MPENNPKRGWSEPEETWLQWMMKVIGIITCSIIAVYVTSYVWGLLICSIILMVAICNFSETTKCIHDDIPYEGTKGDRIGMLIRSIFIIFVCSMVNYVLFGVDSLRLSNPRHPVWLYGIFRRMFGQGPAPFVSSGPIETVPDYSRQKEQNIDGESRGAVW